MDRRKLKSRAHQKPSTENPLTNFEARRIMMALITKKDPSVTMVMGKVRMMKIGLIMAFRLLLRWRISAVLK
jgi:hypothetical protein